MDDKHRLMIKNNKNRLIEITNYYEMKNLLLHKGVFTLVMFDIIEQDHKDDYMRLDSTYNKLIHRGPDAFSKLLEILSEKNNEEALKLLTSDYMPGYSPNYPAVRENGFLSIQGTNKLNRQNSNNSSISPNDEISKIKSNMINNNVIEPDENNDSDGIGGSKTEQKLKLEPYKINTNFNINGLEIKKAQHFGTHDIIPVYPMRSKRRGVFFFVNIINFQNSQTNRNGAERDRENLVTLFKDLNFTVFYYENLKKHEFLNLLEELIESEYIKNVDSFFFCVQTHGDLLNNQTIMEFSDGKCETVEKIISKFSNDACPALIDKPKVFFFPFCRGKIPDRQKYVTIPQLETDGKPSSSQQLRPTFSDVLICYATVPGFLAHRNTEYGSWYVIEICKAIANHAHECHLEELLKLVGTNTMNVKESEGRTQVASYESRGFNKLLFLNPLIQGHSDP